MDSSEVTRVGQVQQFIAGALAAVLVVIAIYLANRIRVRISRKALACWLYELGVMLKHRVPLVYAVEAAGEGSPGRLKRLGYQISEKVREGECLSDVLVRSLAVPKPILAIITAGEVYGVLPDALTAAADLLTRRRGGIHPQTRLLPMDQPAKEPETKPQVPEGYENVSRVVDDASPTVRVAQSIILQAIQSGAEFIELEPVRVEKPPKYFGLQDEEEWKLMDMQVGPQIRVLFGRDRDLWEGMRVPKYVAAPLYRRFKVMAQVPYWQKPPAAGRTAIRCGDREYEMHLDSEIHPLGEKLRIQLRETEGED